MLSDLFIRNLPLPEKGVKRYPDKDGLWLQVSQGGTKTFYFIHGPAQSRRYLKIGRYGPYPHLSLAKAREKVRAIIAKQTLGIEDEISMPFDQDRHFSSAFPAPLTVRYLFQCRPLR